VSTVLSVAIREGDKWILEALDKVAELGKVSKSRVVTEALKAYLEKMLENPPQQSLAPRTTPIHNPVVEQAKDHIKEMEELVRATPGRSLGWYVAAFRKQTGIRPQTGKDYIRTLAALGLVVERGGKLAHKESLLGGLPVIPYFWEHVKRMDASIWGLSRELERVAPYPYVK